jgi:hypothetical protein
MTEPRLQGSMTWQYNGVAPWEEIMAWCDQHIGWENYFAPWETIYFRNDSDHTLFLLRWS